MSWINKLIFLLIFGCFIYELYFRLLARWRQKRVFSYFSKTYIKEAFQIKDIYKHILKNRLLMDTVAAPIIGWIMKPNVNNGVVWTDKNGFRNSALDLKDKIIIAVFGGSVGLGSMASNNDTTITGRLQYYLQQEYGDKVVVLNMAQPSFTMIQEVSLFCLLVDKLDIKISIFIDGHNDVNSMVENKAPFFGFLGPFFGGWSKSFPNVIKVDTFFRTALRFLHRFSYISQHVGNLCCYFKGKSKDTSTENAREIDADSMVLNSFKDLAAVVNGRLRSSKRFALMTLQPVLYDKDRLTEPEREFLLQFCQDRITAWQKYYKILKNKLYKRPHSYFFSNRSNANVVMADFTKITNEVNSTLFVDDCHFADIGNDLYAWNLFNVIKYQEWIDKDNTKSHS